MATALDPHSLPPPCHAKRKEADDCQCACGNEDSESERLQERLPLYTMEMMYKRRRIALSSNQQPPQPGLLLSRPLPPPVPVVDKRTTALAENFAKQTEWIATRANLPTHTCTLVKDILLTLTLKQRESRTARGTRYAYLLALGYYFESHRRTPAEMLEGFARRRLGEPFITLDLSTQVFGCGSLEEEILDCVRDNWGKVGVDFATFLKSMNATGMTLAVECCNIICTKLTGKHGLRAGISRLTSKRASRQAVALRIIVAVLKDDVLSRVRCGKPVQWEFELVDWTPRAGFGISDFAKRWDQYTDALIQSALRIAQDREAGRCSLK